MKKLQQVLGRIYEFTITNVTEQEDVVVPTTSEDVSSIGNTSFFSNDNIRAIPQDDLSKSRIWSSGIGGSEGLRLQASIDKNNTNSNTNNASIKLYNISKEDLAFITTTVKKRLVSLRAGYQSVINNAFEDEFDALPEIFSGDVVNIVSQRQGPDIVTTITAKDSASSLRNVNISKTFPKGKNKKDAIKEIVSSWGTVAFTNNSISSGSKFKSPSFTSSYTAYGSISNVLSELTKDEDLVWHITSSVFYLISKTEPKLVREIIVSSDNIVNEVTPVQNSNLNAKTPQGLNVKLFLDGAIDTDTSIKLNGVDDIQGTSVDGDYNVRTIKHYLDTRGNNWFTELTVEAR